MRIFQAILSGFVAIYPITANSSEQSAVPYVDLESLSAIKFLFSNGDGMYTTIGQESYEALRAVVDVEDLNDLVDAALPKQIEDSLLQKLNLRRGQSVVGLVNDSIFVTKLQGLVLEPSGDGRISGVLGKLFPVRAGDIESDGRPNGICWFTNSTNSALFPLGIASRLKPANLATSDKEMLMSNYYSAGDLHDVRRFDNFDGAELFVGVIRHNDRSADLFTALREYGTFSPVEFYFPSLAESRPVLEIEFREGYGNDLSMYDTKYEFMPDFNNSGFFSLFVGSTVSYVFVLEKQHNTRWTMISSYYRGP